MRHYQEEEIWQRVGKDPSGHPFNSTVQLEMEQGIPRNPFINAGALVVCDMLQGASERTASTDAGSGTGVKRCFGYRL